MAPVEALKRWHDFYVLVGTAGNAFSLEVLAGVLLLLIVNIRNAWDLTLSMARHQSERR